MIFEGSRVLNGHEFMQSPLLIKVAAAFQTRLTNVDFTELLPNLNEEKISFLT